ncbi:uncharacterized protein RHO17_016218, partial [Thomomys bottae]
MRDVEFGVLQTTSLRSSSSSSSSPGPRFGGGAYRPYAPPPSATPCGRRSPAPLPVTGCSEAASPSSVPAAAAASSSSAPLPAHRRSAQAKAQLGRTPPAVRPLPGAASDPDLPPGGGGGGGGGGSPVAGVTHR